jgi:hypothetical protein
LGGSSRLPLDPVSLFYLSQHYSTVLTGRINRTILRAVVVIIGFGLAGYFFWTLYGQSASHIIGE